VYGAILGTRDAFEAHILRGSRALAQSDSDARNTVED
jgi:hypothetical protein